MVDEKSSLVQRKLLLPREDTRFSLLLIHALLLLILSGNRLMSPTPYMCTLRYRTVHPIFSNIYLCIACKEQIYDVVRNHNSFFQDPYPSLGINSRSRLKGDRRRFFDAL